MDTLQTAVCFEGQGSFLKNYLGSLLPPRKNGFYT